MHHTKLPAWRRSRKGNFWTTIRGVRCTVYTGKYGGWNFCVGGMFGEICFDDPREAMRAVEEGFAKATEPTVPASFRFFGLAPNATVDEIKAAYRKWARTTHPDHGGVQGSSATF